MKYADTKVYGDSEGPLGFPMRSDVAKDLEKVIENLDSDCKELMDNGICRVGKAAKVDPDLEARTEVSFVTMDSIDRDKEVVLPKGMDWKQWRKNPVVTWAHNYKELPVGRGLWAKKGEKNGNRGFLAKTEYIGKPEGHEGEWFADSVWHYVKEGYLPGKSIGFIPLEVRAPKEDEIKNRPEMAEVNRVISKSMIIEYAVCPVQSNPDALIDTVSKGIVLPEVIADDLGLVVPETAVQKIKLEDLKWAWDNLKKAEEIEDEIINGTGKNMPEGIINASNTKQLPKKKYISANLLKKQVLQDFYNSANELDTKALSEAILNELKGKV